MMASTLDILNINHKRYSTIINIDKYVCNEDRDPHVDQSALITNTFELLLVKLLAMNTVLIPVSLFLSNTVKFLLGSKTSGNKTNIKEVIPQPHCGFFCFIKLPVSLGVKNNILKLA